MITKEQIEKAISAANLLDYAVEVARQRAAMAWESVNSMISQLETETPSVITEDEEVQ